MKKTGMSEAIKNFFKTTTLHGFKYLYSAYYIDRVGWLICCGASACCAGVLCAVLWARFSEVPAVLTLSDNIDNDELMDQRIPSIIVCPTTENVADMFLQKLPPNQTEQQRIPTILSRLFTRKSITKDQLLLLDEFLVDSNLNLSELMVNYAPGCSQHAKRCRYQETVVPCEQLFQSELTTSGICCTIDPKKFKNLSKSLESRVHTTQMLDLVLQYGQGSKIYGCQLITMFDSEEDSGFDFLLPGTLYMAYHKFIVTAKNPASDDLVESSCVRRNGYTRTSCLMKCAELFCGCRDPLHPPRDSREMELLPICPVARLECVRGSKYTSNITCNCLPPCKRITTSLVLDSSELNVQHTIDPFFRGLNTTSSIVLKLRVNLAHSRKFFPIATDTWVTLLSSLGGVFNMFLGVGLFSALEFLFLILIKLPIAFRKSSEINPIAEHAAPSHNRLNHYHYNENKLFPYRDRQKHQHSNLFNPYRQDSFARY